MKKKMLNLCYLNVTNKTNKVGDLDFIEIPQTKDCYIDYIALYSEVKKYTITENTAVSFYQYDEVFDGKNGLFNSIYFNDEKRLERFKSRFRDVNFFIMPDYSQCSEIERIENLYRMQKARIVSAWLLLNIEGSVVIPNITFCNESDFKYMIEGFNNAEIVAISTKGILKNKEMKTLFVKAIKYLVDNMHELKTICVYSVATRTITEASLFEYAIEHNINVIFPENTLKTRNRMRGNNIWEE